MERNEVVLCGRIVELQSVRYTPAGVPVMALKLHHASEQTEAGIKRRVECEIAAVAMGEAALEMARMKTGDRVKIEGFIARRSPQSRQPQLHVNRIELI